MDGQWVTYAEAAVRLGVSIEAVRQRAIRNKWARMVGNDKRARVRLPDEPYPTQTPVVRASDRALMDALREHNATLKGENETLKAQLRTEADRLAAAEARAEKQAAESAELSAQHAAERAKAEKAIAEFAALADRLTTLAAERSRPWWRRFVG